MSKKLNDNVLTYIAKWVKDHFIKKDDTTQAYTTEFSCIELADVAESGSYNDLTDKPTIPGSTSQLTNDSNFVSDADYVHTDNNFTSAEKTKLSGIATGAEVNVQSDWNQTTTTADDYIKNKPTTISGYGITDAKITSGTITLGTNTLTPVVDANYVHTDNNFTTAEKTKLSTAATLTDGKLTESQLPDKVVCVDSAGLIPNSLLPSYVDDVLEYANLTSFPTTGESGKIYIALDTNLTYRWTGSQYTEISKSLAIGETSTTAYSGSAGKALEEGKVDKTTTIAGLALSGNITKAALLTALSVADGAEVNVQSDWNQTTTTSDDYIKNKPTKLSDFTDDLGTSPTHTHSQYVTDISGKVDKAGDTMTGALIWEDNTGNTSLIRIASNDKDTTLLRVYDKGSGWDEKGKYGFDITYKGTGVQNNNALVINADNQTASTKVEAIKITQDGVCTFAKTISGTITNATNATNATVATKIGTSTVGNSNLPVYINEGVPTAITALPTTALDYGGPTPGLVELATIDTTSADRLAFLPADQIIVEKTTDGGATWVDAGISNGSKRQFFSSKDSGYRLNIPKLDSGNKSCNCALRITITGMKFDVPADTPETEKINYWNSDHVLSCERYFGRTGFLNFWLCSDADRIQCTFETKTGYTASSWTVRNTVDGLDGWQGRGIISTKGNNFGGGTNQLYNNWIWRFTFRTQSSTGTFNDDDLNTNYRTESQYIQSIRAYSSSSWTSANYMNSNGHMYTWDIDQNVTFPNKIRLNGTNYPQVLGNGTYLSLGASTDRTKEVTIDSTSLRRGSLSTSMTLGTSAIPWVSIYGTTIYEGGTALSSKYAANSHTHSMNDVTGLDTALNGKVSTTVKVNGHALSSDVTVTKSDVGLGNVENTALSTWTGSSKLTTCSKGSFGELATKDSIEFSDLSNFPTSLSEFTDDLGSTPTHTHSQYSTTDHTHSQYITDISGKQDVSNLVIAFQTTPDNTHYPSEKLVKDSLDAKSSVVIRRFTVTT